MHERNIFSLSCWYQSRSALSVSYLNIVAPVKGRRVECIDEEIDLLCTEQTLSTPVLIREECFG